MKLVEVLWQDCLMSPLWHTREEFYEFTKENDRIVSMGYLEEETEDRIVLSQSLRNDHRANLISIPKSQIIEITKLRRDGQERTS